LWYTAVKTFSVRNLTLIADKFSALAGIGVRFQQRNKGDTYLIVTPRRFARMSDTWSSRTARILFSWAPCLTSNAATKENASDWTMVIFGVSWKGFIPLEELGLHFVRIGLVMIKGMASLT